MPYVKNVAHTNYCDMGVWTDENTSEIIVI